MMNADVVLPNFASEHLMELLIGLLGLGSLRTVERLRGAANGQPAVPPRPPAARR